MCPTTSESTTLDSTVCIFIVISTSLECSCCCLWLLWRWCCWGSVYSVSGPPSLCTSRLAWPLHMQRLLRCIWTIEGSAFCMTASDRDVALRQPRLGVPLELELEAANTEPLSLAFSLNLTWDDEFVVPLIFCTSLSRSASIIGLNTSLYKRAKVGRASASNRVACLITLRIELGQHLGMGKETGWCICDRHLMSVRSNQHQGRRSPFSSQTKHPTLKGIRIWYYSTVLLQDKLYPR